MICGPPTPPKQGVPLGIVLGGQQKSSRSATGAVLHPVATVSSNAAKRLMEGVIAFPGESAKVTSEEGKEPHQEVGGAARRFTIKVA